MLRTVFARKRVTVVISLVALAAVASVAYAYWTSGGSGTGSASTASSTSALTANHTSALSAMYPGDSQQTISGNFNNPNSNPVYVTSVTASIASVTGGAGSCDATDFSLTSAVMSVGHEVAAGTGVDSFSGAKIQFNDKTGVNQDGCKGATVHLAYAIA